MSANGKVDIGRAAPRGGVTRRLRWLPNAVTAARLVGVPVVSAVAHRARSRTSPPAALLFGAVAATDYVDGALARRLDAKTRFGQIADPAVDRLLNLAGIVALLQVRRLHAAGPALLITRELLAVTGFIVAARRGVLLEVDLAGKGSSALTMIATGLALLTDDPVADVVFWIAVVAAIGTFVHYALHARRLLAEANGAEVEAHSTSSQA